ncbi:acyl-CoA dehydrogenase family protein [Amycolatopsis sp.]|uniref:acyl-CoA dehydrogenase family protein n=1 Tax=Amycolatopsis sp. TaxID=37632 RepID=UPI002E017F5B|nr:acyl-CoA dehydrogenase family protein [Amycolatopsis sp.]
MTSATIRQPRQPELPPPWHTQQRATLLAQAREFVTTRMLPAANELDSQRADIPGELMAEMGELGYFGIMVPEEYGGLGLGVFEYCMISEELARAWLSSASIIARAQGLGTGVADPGRREELLRRSARGDWIGAAAFSEPDAGSDLGSVTTTAVRDGDEFVISGHKRWCGNAVASDFIVVLCRVQEPGAETGRAALRTLLVEKRPGELSPGVTGQVIDKIGYFGMTTYDLTFDEVRVPLSAQVEAFGMPVARGEGFRALETGLNMARVQTAARAVGLARAAVEDSAVYLQQRRQFGRPVGEFQSLRFMLAEMAARVDQARAYYRQVAELMDAGVPCEQEAAMVKLAATEMAVEVTGQAIQLHGGNGYTTEHQVERYWRDARLTTIFEGTSQIQQLIVSDRMLGKVRQR